jgi:hypothetical protein
VKGNRKGICIGKIPCSRKNGEMIAIGERQFSRCHLSGLVDCRYLILLQDLKPEILQILKG